MCFEEGGRMRLQLAMLVAAISWASLVAAADEKPVEFRYWTSPDGMELYLAATDPAESGGPRLYYFSNDTSSVCYTFTVSGPWTLDESTGKMQSEDDRGSLGKSVLGPDELGIGSGPELVGAAIESYQSQFAESLSTLAEQGFKEISKPGYSTEPFPAAGREAVKWMAHATGSLKGQRANIRQNQVFVEVVPGWILAVESRDDVAREAIESLGTAQPPDCYWPYIHEHFPLMPTP